MAIAKEIEALNQQFREDNKKIMAVLMQLDSNSRDTNIRSQTPNRIKT